MRVLVTRPEPDAHDEVEELAARGHEGIVSPLLVIEQVNDVALDLDGAQALIVTSRNALRALSSIPRSMRPARCRSSPWARRRRARRASLALPTVIEGPGNGAGLAELIVAQGRTFGRRLWSISPERRLPST